MKHNYYLFAKAIYESKTSTRPISYDEYIRHESDKKWDFRFDTYYIDSYRPCLVIKNLFDDLFTGSNIYSTDSNGRMNPDNNTPSLLINVADSAKDVCYFFPSLKKNKRKEYSSRFRSGDESANNYYANTLYKELMEDSKACITAVETACDKFFRHDCTVPDVDELKAYLVSRINIFIELIETEKNRFSIVEEINEELKADILSRMKTELTNMQNNLPWLLSRLLIVAGLRRMKVNSLIMEALLLGKKIDKNMKACDKFYTAYCERSKTAPGKLETAYSYICRDARYYKEISIDYAAYLMQTDSEEKQKQARQILESLCEEYDDFGRALSLLALCYSEGIGCEACEESAHRLYARAAELGDGRAMLALAEEAYASDLPARRGEAVELCQRILETPPIYRGDTVGKAAFIIAEFYHKHKRDNLKAREYYIISSEAGYEPATQRLKQLNRPNRYAPSEINSEGEEEYRERHIIVSGCEDAIDSIRQKMQSSSWHMKLISEDSAPKSDIRQIVCEYLSGEYSDNMSAEEYPERSVFVFAESNEDRNLHNALYLLDRLYAKYGDIIVGGGNDFDEKARRLMSSFDIYLSADFENASMMIDSSLAEMGDEVYFRVHICDINKDLSDQLIYRAPLFIPTIRGEGNPRVVTFGGSDFIYSFIREVTASCYMINHQVEITAIDGNISRIKNRFKQNCGGIYTAGLNRKITPDFLNYDLSRADFDDIVSGKLLDSDEGLRQVKDRIAEGNYFVVDVGSDMENVAFAKNLRAWLLRSDITFHRMPFIAVRCRDSVNAFWISRLHSGGSYNSHWFNDYNFYIFGMVSEVYPSVITDALIERIALGVHLSYDPSPTEKEVAHFWQSTYSQDSSRATAVGLVYRLYDAGVALSNCRDYHHLDFKSMRTLAEEYVNKLNGDSELIDVLAAAEQSRWNCFMLSRGWLPATNEQVRAYQRVGGHKSHKHPLCRLHPYIRDWERLGDDEHTEKAKESSGGGMTPKEITVKSIVDTRVFFNEPPVTPAIEGRSKEK